MRLTTARFVLDPLDPDRDALDLHPACSDPQNMAYWYLPPTTSVEETRRFLARGVEALEWTVREHGDPRALGTVGIEMAGPVPGIHALLCPDARGRRMGPEAMGRVVRYAFEDLGVEFLEAWIDPENLASIRGSESIGFVHRGRIATRWPRRSAGHELVVLGASRVAPEFTFTGIEPTMEVTDVEQTARLLRDTFDFRVEYADGDPPTFATLRIAPWASGPRVTLRRSAGEVTPSRVCFHVGLGLDALYERAAAALVVEQCPTTQPWFRRDFVVATTEGHRLVFSGPP